jgi:hypothetical protein
MRFVVLRMVIVKNIFFWDVTPFSLVKVGHRLGGTCCRHLKVTLLFNPEDGGIMFLRNVGKHVRLHDASPQKTVFFRSN